MSTDQMPTVFLGHGAPILLEDQRWMGQLAQWAQELPRPEAIVIVSAHWEHQPIALSSIEPAPLIYDFGGFDPKYYSLRYDAPTAPAVASRIANLLSDTTEVVQTQRGLDHGAYIPLMAMYPEADIPVVQMSLPTLRPEPLLQVGEKIAELRHEGVLIIGSGFLTHGLPYISMADPDAPAPGWSADFDLWASNAVMSGDLESLCDFEHRAPALRYAHPTTEHLVPLFVVAGAAHGLTGPVENTIDGYWFGLAKRSFTFS
ncbi:MAG TPA: dioxygenase [Actinobacteria bacterium]|nr:dioxygenase [Actinomycetota bacterium]